MKMTMKRSDDFAEIKKQAQFCAELMLRLNEDIQKSGQGDWSGMAEHSRKQDDAKRIRRELLALQKMLNPWGQQK
jgi:hypothetical protein